MSTITAGIDAGTKTIKTVLIEDNTSISNSILNLDKESTDESVRGSLNQVLRESAVSGDAVKYIMVTGAGGRFVSLANGFTPEFVCLCRGMERVNPNVRTILDIGSDKTLVVRCVHGIPLRVERNDRCAAGTGRFLERVSETLKVPLDQMQEFAREERERLEIQNTCAVFAESEIISLIHQKKSPEDIMKGVLRSLALRIYTQLLEVGLEKEIAMTGGVAKNRGLSMALEKRVNARIYVPSNPEMIAALGAGIIAQGKVR